jgi:hypothetical protein
VSPDLPKCTAVRRTAPADEERALPRQTSGAITGLEMFEGVLDWGLRIAALGLILITGYYVVATLMYGNQLFAAVGPDSRSMSVADFQRHLGNMELLTKLLLLASVLGIVCALGRFYQYPETGMVLLLLGALLFFGMPFLVDNMGGSAQLHRSLARLGDPRAFLKGRYVLAGAAFAGAGALQLIAHGFLFVVSGRKRRPRPNEEAAKTAQQVKKPNDKFLGACWELPFCRDTDKKLCPIRREKKSCWRTGRGCYCDQNVILTLSGGNQYAASRGASGYLSYTATVARPKSLREKREQCLQCPVYLHRQSQKYKLLAPVSLIAAVGLVAYYWETVKNLYPDGMRAVGRALSNFSFGGTVGGVPTWANDLAINQGIMWLLIIVGVVLLLAYLLQGLEWLLYRLGV